MSLGTLAGCGRVEQLDVTTPIDTTHARVGVGAGAGAYSSEYRIRNFVVTEM